MVKIKYLILMLVLLVLFLGCSFEKNNQTFSTANSSQSEENISRDIVPDYVMQKSLQQEKESSLKLPELSDTDLRIDGKIANSQNEGFVYLISDYRYDISKKHDLYLAVEVMDRTSFYKLEFTSYEDYLYLCDVDGDGYNEIVLRQFVDAAGGAGQHVAAVYKIDKGCLRELFFSAPIEGRYFNAGFSATVSGDGIIKLTNTNAGYQISIEMLEDDVNSNEKIGESVPLIYGSLFEFKPKDVNNDGVFEIETSQTLDIIAKGSLKGKATCVLKFNAESQIFEVIEASFSYT